ncbi:MAG: PIG-L family deacetylase [Deltaproteobacteria bacterium]|nr:PIG-L family deacetylase [Deltaproteobacteria bacterium]MBW2307651.1 PIG-L family deacetylase [Deltaproteobacteria bacterium]
MQDLVEFLSPIMVIAAHPDDAEIQCGGTVHRLVLEGKEVIYVICTTGNRGSHSPGMALDELAEVRKNEQLQAAAELGVTEVNILKHDDGDLIFHPQELREDLVRFIRRYAPQTIMTHDPFAGIGTYNVCYLHPDHRTTGMVAFDACFFCSDSSLSYPDHLSNGLAPHGISAMFLFMTEHPDVFVDISLSFQKKVSAISRHQTQWGKHPDLEGFFAEMAQNIGRARKLEKAEAFKIVKR